MPLIERKKILKEVLEKINLKKIIYSPYWTDKGSELFASACQSHLEGIISKKKDSLYSHGRSKSWLKIKCKNVQEFIIGGYTLQEESEAIGALLLGAMNGEGELQYVGRVGTGFNQSNSKNLLKQLKKLKNNKSFFEKKSPVASGINWVEPQLIANVEFGAWTEEKILRHASFKGLREDKKAKDVKLEVAQSKKNKKKTVKKNSEIMELSHPEKILYTKGKITKKDLAEYYVSISKWIIPHAKDRPLALLRCPDGEGKECFFQKHAKTDSEGILGHKVESKLKKKKEEVLTIDSTQGLIELVQLGTLEIHARGGLYTEIDYANQIVFDLDPDVGVSFEKVKEAALELKNLLDELKLKSFVKTTGGKGLHIHVPLKPIYNWDQIKNFSKAVCEELEKRKPHDFTTNMSKAKRKGRIFLDYLRNGYGASAILPYSARAHPHAPIAMPISWEEVRKLKSSTLYTLEEVPGILEKRKDPWGGFLRLKQRIKALEQ